jgi:hypothetical protein
MRELIVKIRLNETQDWSVEINGRPYEHISADVMEELVAVAVIETEMSLIEPGGKIQ